MDQNKIKLDSIEEAINDFREGKFIVVVDDEDRENEGDLIIAAEKSLPTTSISCLRTQEGVVRTTTNERCRELDLPHQVEDNTSMLGTPFTVTVDKLEGCSTEFPPKTAPPRYAPLPTRLPGLRLLAARVISIPFTHKTGA